jgi:hypothetical protein
MTWDEQLFSLLDDLEQQAEGVFAAERDLEVAERAQAEYAAVTLATRLMASVGREVVLQVEGVGPVAGTLRRVADGWSLVAGPRGEWLVRAAAVASARGLSERSVPVEAWPATARLGLGSALRRIASSGQPCRLLLRDGTAHTVRLARIGADFVEARVGENAREVTVFAWAGLAAVQQGSGDDLAGHGLPSAR